MGTTAPSASSVRTSGSTTTTYYKILINSISTRWKILCTRTTPVIFVMCGLVLFFYKVFRIVLAASRALHMIVAERHIAYVSKPDHGSK
eukprot:scaffold388657_cov18-Prasinocladus_malaysianus.AAC.1